MDRYVVKFWNRRKSKDTTNRGFEAWLNENAPPSAWRLAQIIHFYDGDRVIWEKE